MVQPKRRTKSSKKRRASHFAQNLPRLISCPKCKKPTRPHQVCPFCGTYQGREVIKIKTKKKKVKK